MDFYFIFYFYFLIFFIFLYIFWFLWFNKSSNTKLSTLQRSLITHSLVDYTSKWLSSIIFDYKSNEKKNFFFCFLVYSFDVFHVEWKNSAYHLTWLACDSIHLKKRNFSVERQLCTSWINRFWREIANFFKHWIYLSQRKFLL